MHSREEMLTQDEKRRSGSVAFPLIALCLLLGAIALSWVPYRLPDPKPAASASEEFSAERAEAHLRALAQHPRPAGSEAHRQARQYLTEQLAALGLERDRQVTTVASKQRNIVARVHNVIGRIRSGADRRAVLLVAHYDSVNAGSGANDNAVAVAALLEAIRALKTGPALRHDVLVLFTDGEEVGLFGAEAFVSEHPWAKDVELVLNFEARGSQGPSLMFETSRENAWLARGLKQAQPSAIASSLFYEIYQRLPNDTDFSVFKRAEIAGMNFAYVGGVTDYHTRLDNISSVDPRNLQHHGEYALNVVRHFGDGDWASHSTRDAIFFNVPLLGLVVYDASLSVPLAGCVVILFVLAFWRARSRRVLARRAAFGALALIAMIAAITFLAAMLWQLIDGTNPAMRWMTLGEPYGGVFYFGAFVLLAIALFLKGHSLLRRRFTINEAFAGAILIWVVLTLFTAVLLPGASYLFAWPALFACIGLALLVRKPADAQRGTDHVAVGLSTVPAVLLWAPLIYLIYLGMTIQAVTALVGLIALVMCLALPLVEALGGMKRYVSMAALAVAVTLLGLVRLSAPFDNEHPRPNSLFYVMDSERETGMWASSDQTTDSWTAQYLGSQPRRDVLPEPFGWRNRTFLLADALPLRDASPPEFELLSQIPQDNGRLIRMRLRSPRGADQMWVSIGPGPSIERVVLGGEELFGRARDDMPWVGRLIAPPPEGVEMEILVGGFDEVRLQMADRVGGLPATLMEANSERPPDTMPTLRIDEFQDATFMTAEYLVAWSSGSHE